MDSKGRSRCRCVIFPASGFVEHKPQQDCTKTRLSFAGQINSWSQIFILRFSFSDFFYSQIFILKFFHSQIFILRIFHSQIFILRFITLPPAFTCICVNATIMLAMGSVGQGKLACAIKV